MTKPVEGAVAAVASGLTPAAADTTPSVSAEARPEVGAPPRVSVPPIATPGRDAAARRRATLRIPDDEIARPQPADGAARAERVSELPVGTEVPAVVMPTRIISIDSTPPPAPAPRPTPPAVPVVARPSMPPPVTQSVAPPPPVAPDSEPITPRVSPLIEADEVEVRFDDDVPTPLTPRVAELVLQSADDQTDGERRSEPGVDAPEVAAEDVVALEPAPSRPAAVLPPMRPRALSQPGSTAPSPASFSAPVAATPGSARSPPSPDGPSSSAPSPRPALVIVPPHVGSMPGTSPEANARRKGRLWWEDLFNDDYLRTAERVSDEQIARETAFIEESLGVERGGAVLDVACGTGRHAIELARRGYEVVGFDLSLAMLARAGEEAQERGAQLNLMQGDMREMTFEEQFDGIYCWSTSFGYFDEEKNAQVIDRVHRALKAGGFFLVDVANRDFVIRQSPSLAWFEGDGCVCMDEMTVDFITSRMKVKRTLMLDDGRSREIEYSVRVYSLHELGRILHEHGFKVREVSGRLATPGVFFGEESPRTIILAEKH